ncbi:MAG: 4-hydroxy-tetrahydrodipicolinate reductase [Lentimicrobium sp.]
MRIILSGYGRMGHEIEKIAGERGHTIVATPDNSGDWENINLGPDVADVVIDFSTPQSAEWVVNHCLNSAVAVVSGTTGWQTGLEKSKEVCKSLQGAFFYAPNFSIGVNIFFEINRTLAKLMAGKTYRPLINEIHHIHKLDAPSGTAIALANDIISVNPGYTRWEPGFQNDQQVLPVLSERTGEVIGTHKIEWDSEADSIEIKHTAHNRKGLAMGAILAAEWLQGRSGIYSMADLLSSGR